MTFAVKELVVQLDLGQGSFGGSGGNSAKISGLRVSANIETTGGPALSTCEVAIFGMKLATMNQLSTLGTEYGKLANKNGMMIYAGDQGGQMSLVFQGVIASAWVDAQSQPQVCFRILGTSGTFYNTKTQTPISFSGSVPASTVVQKAADMLGLQLKNNGVKTVLSNPYFGSDAISMIRKAAEHAGFVWAIEKGNVVISPPNKPLSGDPILVSKETGMVGYPVFSSQNVIVKKLFDPNIEYLKPIQIKSELTTANGVWTVQNLKYELESRVPRGKWFNIMTCSNPSAQPTTQSDG